MIKKNRKIESLCEGRYNNKIAAFDKCFQVILNWRIPKTLYFVSRILTSKLSLIVELVPVKSEVKKSGRYWKSQKCFNRSATKLKKHLQKVKGGVKAGILNDVHILFIVEIVDDFAPAALEQMRGKFVEKHSKILFQKLNFIII